MIEKYSTARVDSRLLEIFSDLSWIKEKIGELVSNPTAEAAQDVEATLAKFANSSDALRNAITTLVKEIAGVVVDENGDMEIDVVPDEHGLRIS